MNKIKNIFREIKDGIYNLFIFLPVIWKFRPFDYGFLLNVDKIAMLEMRDYFEKSNIAEGNDDNARYLRLAVNLLRQMDKTSEYYRHELKVGKPILYINTRNAPNGTVWSRNHDRVFQYDWYEEKCWRLYHRILKEKMREWWD